MLAETQCGQRLCANGHMKAACCSHGEMNMSTMGNETSMSAPPALAGAICLHDDCCRGMARAAVQIAPPSTFVTTGILIADATTDLVFTPRVVLPANSPLRRVTFPETARYLRFRNFRI